MEDEGFVLVSAKDDDEDIAFSGPSTPDSNSGSDKKHGSERPPKYLSEIDKLIDSLADELWPLNTFLYSHPELAFNEYKAHDALTEFMRSRKDPHWNVTPSAYGIATAWTAVYDSGKPGPVVSFNAEMDALPNLGHACGHNLISTTSLSAALAAATIMQRHYLGGKLVLLGTPGEEGTIGGKTLLLARGAYNPVDVTLISHPSIINNSPLIHTTAFSRLTGTFSGRASHAANAPWKGLNALDGAVHAYTGVALLRQQSHPSTVMSLAIPDGGGDVTNTIHARASITCVARSHPSLSSSTHETLEHRITACFRAGALATGCDLDVQITPGYLDHVPNAVLARRYAANWESLPDGRPPDPPIPRDDRPVYVNASTDQGNLSHALPSINVSFAIPPGPDGGPPHSADFAKAAGTRAAFARALRVGKALAGTAADILTAPGLLGEVKAQWRRDMDAVKGREGVAGLLQPRTPQA